MEKFLLIPVTSLGNVLLSVKDIKLIRQATDLSTVITYDTGKTATITHATSVNTFAFREFLQDNIVAILKDNWTTVTRDAIPAFAVSAIAFA